MIEGFGPPRNTAPAVAAGPSVPAPAIDRGGAVLPGAAV